MNSSDINFDAYNQKANVYIEKNPGGTTGGLTPEERARNFQKFLPKGRVLEIGSGAGLDADALDQAGFEVIASDYVPSFVELLQGSSYQVITLDAKNDTIPSGLTPLDGIYANAVFVHFSPNDFKNTLTKFNQALRDGGYMYFSVMHGEGTEVAGRAKGIEREFFYYKNEDLNRLLEETGFTIDKIEYPIDEKWIHVICHKN
jgi:SAM-dependent methyltransferase